MIFFVSFSVKSKSDPMARFSLPFLNELSQNNGIFLFFVSKKGFIINFKSASFFLIRVVQRILEQLSILEYVITSAPAIHPFLRLSVRWSGVKFLKTMTSRPSLGKKKSIACPFAHTAHSFACSGLLAFRALRCAHSFAPSLLRSLHSLPRSWESG